MNINQISAATPLASKGGFSNIKPRIAFKANYQQIVNEGKSLIKKDVSFSALKKIITYLQNKFSPSREIPMVENALLLYFSGLQTKKEFFEEYAQKTLSGEYIDTATRETASIIKKLESSRVIKPWEYPENKVMFYDGHLTDSAYNEIRNKIMSADYYKLNNVEKHYALNDLAQSCSHYEDVSCSINFSGTLENDFLSSSEFPEEIVESGVDIIQDGSDGFWENIIDFFSDLF